MKTICAMRDVFKAMGNFETAFEKMSVSYTHLTLPTT